MTKAAQALFDAGYPDVAAGRAYYAFFHAAKALLAEANIAAHRHRTVRRESQRLLEQVDPAGAPIGAWFDAAATIRVVADYGLNPTVTEYDAQQQIERSVRFRSAIRDIILSGVPRH
jgi:uncharacterized protein (UPF0332 family)